MPSDLVARAEAEWRAARPDLDPSPILIIGRVSRLARFVTDDLVALYRQFDLSENEFDLLATLRRSPNPEGLTQRALTQVTFVTKGAVSKLLDGLESRGLIVRRADREDGRARLVSLTDDGRALIDRAIAAHFGNERRMLAGLSGEDRRDLERILASWLTAYEDADPAQ